MTIQLIILKIRIMKKIKILKKPLRKILIMGMIMMTMKKKKKMKKTILIERVVIKIECHLKAKEYLRIKD